jgi:hypothetical protein
VFRHIETHIPLDVRGRATLAGDDEEPPAAPSTDAPPPPPPPGGEDTPKDDAPAAEHPEAPAPGKPTAKGKERETPKAPGKTQPCPPVFSGSYHSFQKKCVNTQNKSSCQTCSCASLPPGGQTT